MLKPCGVITLVVLMFGVSCTGASGPVAAPSQAQAPGQPELTPLRLVSAMPAGCESVMVRHVEALLSKGSTQADIMRAELEQYAAAAKLPKAEPGAQPDAWGRVLGVVVAHTPITQCLGGSQFTRPEGFGVGRFNAREVWVLGKPLTKEDEATIARFNGVTVASDSPVRIFKMPKVDPGHSGRTATEMVYVALWDRRAVIRAQSIDDVREIFARLSATDPALPKRWEKVADTSALSSVILVLRAFDPHNPEGNWQLTKPLERSAEHPDLLRFTLQRADDPAPELACITTNSAAARPMLKHCAGSVEPQTTATGLAVPKNPAPKREQTSVIMLQADVAMGLYVAM